MKSLAFSGGALLGFVLCGLMLASPPLAPPGRPVDPVSSGQVAQIQDAAEPKSAEQSPPVASATVIPATTPARTRPRAFMWGFSFGGAPSTKGLSPEDLADPQFAELYRQAVRARAADEFAPHATLLQLTPQQFDTLVAVAMDQALDFQALPQTTDRQLRLKRLDDLSSLAEARLGTALTPEQMEQLAGLAFGARDDAAMLDGYAARNLAFSPEQVRQMWTTENWRTPGGNYARPVINIEKAESSLTPEQSRLRANQKRWEEAARFRAAISSARVRDPDLFDIWPK